ncbi:MarR family winged helix-turn-helix transcriptional regulator [Glaciihabitans sp. dw_435]|uniref:MarR family winged helix-turn-helix transcriptional regulator n=1 Tax=Glaciihabitans sp. dw_435 TaxID=2720081 RepID=UPI001BD45C23|nr:MarR family transcriptional regulator [Glaciihabitans sp. dw_435]
MTDTEFIPLGMDSTRLTKAFETEIFRRLAEAGYSDLRMRHSMLLELLARGGARSSVLASQLGVTKQAMGEMIDDLEKTNYIRRVDDPADRRAKLVVLSDKGHTAFTTAFEILAQMEREFADHLGETEYAAVRDAITRLTTHLETK